MEEFKRLVKRKRERKKRVSETSKAEGYLEQKKECVCDILNKMTLGYEEKEERTNVSGLRSR